MIPGISSKPRCKVHTPQLLQAGVHAPAAETEERNSRQHEAKSQHPTAAIAWSGTAKILLARHRLACCLLFDAELLRSYTRPLWAPAAAS